MRLRSSTSLNNDKQLLGTHQGSDCTRIKPGMRIRQDIHTYTFGRRNRIFILKLLKKNFLDISIEYVNDVFYIIFVSGKISFVKFLIL